MIYKVLFILIAILIIFLKIKTKKILPKREGLKALEPKKTSTSNVAIVVGHNVANKGAYSKKLELAEYDYWLEVAKHLQTKGYDIYTREPITSYSKQMQNLCNKLNSKPYDLIIELHFNGAGSSRANGLECLAHHKSTKGLAYAQKFCEMAQAKFYTKNRGVVKIQKETDRGAYGIFHTKAPYILTELFFGSNDECLFFKDTKKVAEFYHEFIKEVVG